ncbi:3975_t:CDS:2 [Ambispora gerdemannii]|uniref:3975_t:CDS:1 n=1 Tax=Ambispora gerdemannii TaxID=144530 RepID=A0A9N9BUZ7_9GLOM|nr:3975_t:CDS:2 [Ambispora gerdemannii]
MSSTTLCENKYNDKDSNEQELHNKKRIILFAFNNTEASRAIYQWALENYFQSETDHIYLLSVIKTPQILSQTRTADLWIFGAGMLSGVAVEMFNYKEYLHWQQKKEAEVRSYLEELKNELSSRNITSSMIIIEGNPHDEILNVCDNVNPDVVLMGTSLNKKNLFSRSSSKVSVLQKKLTSTPIVTLSRENKPQQLNSDSSKKKIRKTFGFIKHSLCQRASYSSLSKEKNTYTKLE